MRLVKSELVLEEFFIVKSDYVFNEPQENEVDIKSFMSDYDIDIDFIVRDIKDEDNKYMVFAKVSINHTEQALAGYSLFAESVSIYSFSDACKLTEKEKSDFLWSSGVSISINCLRNYLSSITSYCPLGKYMLPSVDLTSLLNTKRIELNKKMKKGKK